MHGSIVLLPVTTLLFLCLLLQLHDFEISLSPILGVGVVVRVCVAVWIPFLFAVMGAHGHHGVGDPKTARKRGQRTGCQKSACDKEGGSCCAEETRERRREGRKQ